MAAGMLFDTAALKRDALLELRLRIKKLQTVEEED